MFRASRSTSFPRSRGGASYLTRLRYWCVAGSSLAWTASCTVSRCLPPWYSTRASETRKGCCGFRSASLAATISAAVGSPRPSEGRAHSTSATAASGAGRRIMKGSLDVTEGIDDLEACGAVRGDDRRDGRHEHQADPAAREQPLDARGQHLERDRRRLAR